MGISAIGTMNVSGYVYNTNHVTAKSLNKINKISEDVLDSRREIRNDSTGQNENPLKMGETPNFAALMEREMYRGMNRASMLGLL